MMGTRFYSSSSSEEEEEEDESEVIDLTHPEVAPPAPSAQNPRKRRAVGNSEGETEKRLCVEPPKPGDNEAYKCPICIEYVRDREPMSTKCGHVFCKDCIQAAKLQSHFCPLCKKKFLVRHLRRVFV